MTQASQHNQSEYDQRDRFSYLNERHHRVRVQKSIDLIQQYRNSKIGKLAGLDLGCGDGAVAQQILGLGIQMHGIDIASEQLKLAAKRGIQIKEGDFQKELPYKDESYDVVFAGEVIEHIVDPRLFVTEVNRILKPGGLFVVSSPNLAGFDNRIK